MSQEERTQLIREIKELFELDYRSIMSSRGEIIDKETKNTMNAAIL